jgi:hypothetical protein
VVVVVVIGGDCFVIDSNFAAAMTHGWLSRRRRRQWIVIGASQRCEKERRNVAGEIERKKSVEREREK